VSETFKGDHGEGVVGDAREEKLGGETSAYICVSECSCSLSIYLLFIRLEKFTAACLMTCIAGKIHQFSGLNLTPIQEHTLVKRSFHLFLQSLHSWKAHRCALLALATH